MVELYRSMYFENASAPLFGPMEDGARYEARQGPPGTVEVWIHRIGEVGVYYQSVLNVSMDQVRGERG